MANKVEICGVNTAKLPLYKDEEMQEMLIAIKNGDKEVRDKFITGNLRLVLSVIHRFKQRYRILDRFQGQHHVLPWHLDFRSNLR